jgi:hypothetical protein
MAQSIVCDPPHLLPPPSVPLLLPSKPPLWPRLLPHRTATHHRSNRPPPPVLSVVVGSLITPNPNSVTAATCHCLLLHWLHHRCHPPL